MKPLLIGALLFAGCSPAFAAQPGQCGPGFEKWDLNCDGKIDGDEASASMQPFYDQQKRVSHPTHYEGLPPPSEAGYPEKYRSMFLGRWEKLSKKPRNKPFTALLGDHKGIDCMPLDSYGIWEEEKCHHVGNGDYDCEIKPKYYHCTK